MSLDLCQYTNTQNTYSYANVTTLEKKDVLNLYNLIKKHIEEYDKDHRTLIATFKRIENLYNSYSQSGNKLFIVKNKHTLLPIACSGIGSFRGLHPNEGIGEIRDLVVEPKFRNQGLGKKIFLKCLDFAKFYGYTRIYLETTPNMTVAQKLFIRNKFKPVEELPNNGTKNGFPSYYVLNSIIN